MYYYNKNVITDIIESVDDWLIFGTVQFGRTTSYKFTIYIFTIYIFTIISLQVFVFVHVYPFYLLACYIVAVLPFYLFIC